MSRKLAVVSLAMLVLVGAMALKTAVTVQGSNAVLMANGTSPQPLPLPHPTHQGSSRNGTSPQPLPLPGQQ